MKQLIEELSEFDLSGRKEYGFSTDYFVLTLTEGNITKLWHKLNELTRAYNALLSPKEKDV